MKAVLLFFLYFSTCLGERIVFDLSDYDPRNTTTHLLKHFTNLTVGLTEIQVTNVPADTYFIVQVHSFIDNVTLSSTLERESQTFIKGTNLGLVSLNNTIFYIFAENETNALIVIVIYQNGDPVPGGCNLTFPTEVAPYQLISYTDDLVIVQSQPPFAYGTTCERNNIDVEMYHLYLHENNYESVHYFDYLQKMLTVEDIKCNGRKVFTEDGYFKYRKLYSSYRGIGQVFAIIATFHNRTSAYVPAISYGCDLSNEAESCIGPVTPHWKLICAILLIFGLFMCFWGHKFFRTTLYLIGFMLGIFITYVILSFNDSLGISEKTTISIIIGLVYGSVWLLVWWKFGIPILSISTTFLLTGFLLSSIISYAGVADLSVFHSDVDFWIVQCSIVISFFIIMFIFTLKGHLFACSFLGSYACIAALNYYIGGNLQYIIINAYRRIAVEHFRMATIDPPYQVLDIYHTVFWIVLIGFGYYIQWREQRGKPPFPPPRCTTIANGMDETTPLTQSETPVYMTL